jgi:nitrite reductase (NO-forming)
MKRILSLLALCAAAGALLFVAIPAGASTTATTVKVTAKEFKFVLSRKTAPHGKVTFKVTNKGKIKHDFKIAGKKTTMLKPGKSASLTVTLAKGKTYTYICTVPGHAQAGMKGKFKAT